MTRALATLVGAAIAGGLVWVAAQLDTDTTGGYWAVTGILAGAGLALALARLPDVGVRTLALAPAALALAFLPALVAGGWVIVATQPHGNWARRHVLDWSGDVAIGGIVRDLGPYAGVLAFGLGVVLGLAFERRGVGALAAPAAEKEDAPTRPTTRVEEDVRDRELVGHS